MTEHTYEIHNATRNDYITSFDSAADDTAGTLAQVRDLLATRRVRDYEGGDLLVVLRRDTDGGALDVVVVREPRATALELVK